MAMGENNAEKGAEWLKKAAAARPDNAVIYTYLGICLSSLAATTEDSAKSKDYYKQAIDAFDKAKDFADDAVDKMKDVADDMKEAAEDAVGKAKDAMKKD